MSCPALFGWCAALCAHLSTLSLDPATGENAMKPGAIFVVIASLCGAAYIIFRVGFAAIVDAVFSVGWAGFALLVLYGAATIMLLGIAWLALVPPYSWSRAVTFCWSRAARDSAGEVLPFSQIGGLVIGARAAILRG